MTATPEAPDLEAIRARYRLAAMAGEDAEWKGWTLAKINAVVRSWQDVSDLHDYVKALTEAEPAPRHRGGS